MNNKSQQQSHNLPIKSPLVPTQEALISLYSN